VGGRQFRYDRGDTLYFCRALYKGNYIPGVYHKVRQTCIFSWEGEEIVLHAFSTYKFQVVQRKLPLVYKFRWVKKTIGIPYGAIEGGMTAKGEKMYFVTCRIKSKTGYIGNLPGRCGSFPQRGETTYSSKILRCNRDVYFLTCS